MSAPTIAWVMRTHPVPQRDRSNSQEMINSFLIQSLTMCSGRKYTYYRNSYIVTHLLSFANSAACLPGVLRAVCAPHTVAVRLQKQLQPLIENRALYKFSRDSSSMDAIWFWGVEQRMLDWAFSSNFGDTERISSFREIVYDDWQRLTDTIYLGTVRRQS